MSDRGRVEDRLRVRAALQRVVGDDELASEYEEAAAEIDALRAKLADLTRLEALSREVVRRQKIDILSLQRRCTIEEAAHIYAEEFWSGGEPKVDV